MVTDEIATIVHVSPETLAALDRLLAVPLQQLQQHQEHVLQLPVILRALFGMMCCLLCDETKRQLLPSSLYDFCTPASLAGNVTVGGNCNVLLREAIALLSRQVTEL